MRLRFYKYTCYHVERHVITVNILHGGEYGGANSSY